MFFGVISVPTFISSQPLSEYQEIVRRVNALFRVRLQMSVVVASCRCERLTQAVLGKAFAGKL